MIIVIVNALRVQGYWISGKFQRICNNARPRSTHLHMQHFFKIFDYLITIKISFLFKQYVWALCEWRVFDVYIFCCFYTSVIIQTLENYGGFLKIMFSWNFHYIELKCSVLSFDCIYEFNMDEMLAYITTNIFRKINLERGVIMPYWFAI